jgi:XTP/dITP diphosphohydrolase
MRLKELIVATKNPGKAAEIRARLKGVRVLTLADFPDIPDIAETADSFYGNALLKARAVYERLKKPVLADDSGLCVQALAGAPGVRSARYAGPGAGQAGLIAKLLREMKGKSDRSAYFRTVMVYLDLQGRVHRASGTVRGRILTAPRGTGGFGYDPVFFYHPYGRSFAELSREEKNRISHRSRALTAIMAKICLNS